MEIEINQNHFDLIEKFGERYWLPMMFILRCDKTSKKWTARMLAKKYKLRVINLNNFIKEMREKNMTNFDQKNEKREPFWEPVFFGEKKSSSPIPEPTQEKLSTGDFEKREPFWEPVSFVAQMDHKNENLDENTPHQEINMIYNGPINGWIYLEEEENNDVKQEEIGSILKPDQYRSHDNCDENAFEFQSFECNLYKNFTTCNQKRTEDNEDRNHKRILLATKNPVKNFDNISYYILEYYKTTFNIVSNDNFDEMHLKAINKALHAKHSYYTLCQAITGYRISTYFMKINDLPSLAYIFKTDERIFQLSNIAIRDHQKNSNRCQNVTSCSLYNKEDNDHKKTACFQTVPNGDKYMIDGQIVCYFHYRQHLANKDPEGIDAIWVKSILENL